MNWGIKFQLLLFFVLLPILIRAQEKLPAGYFRSPLDINPYVTGTFGEIRRDHLHSGIDFATGDKTGINVYAVADGYVSRIKISANGYGRALYLTHPNGFVSVYAHLDEFNVVVEDYVARKQYEKESFEIELFPNPVLFRIKKGDIIGYSGNSGASTGPHLHFEIRREKSEWPLNPGLFGIYAADMIPPTIQSVRIYPYGGADGAKGMNGPLTYTFDKNKITTNYNIPDTAKVSGSCYLGIIADDLVSGNNIAGPYSVELYVDSFKYFSYALDSFSFDETRYVNDMIDYSEYIRTGDRYQVLKTSPGNKLSVYDVVNNHGILTFTETAFHRVEIRVKDFAGNTTTLSFVLSGSPANTFVSKEYPAVARKRFDYQTSNHFETNDIRLDFPAFSMYDDLDFDYRSLKNPINHFSDRHCIHNKYVPLQKPYNLSLRMDSVPEKLKWKAVIVRYGGPDDLVSIGGEISGQYISSKTYLFGDYLIAVDTTAPKLEPVNFKDGKKINGLESLIIKATDVLSGINVYRAEVNGKWVLMEYDMKNDLLVIPVNEKISQGDFKLFITVNDNRGNVSSMIFRLTR